MTKANRAEIIYILGSMKKKQARIDSKRFGVLLRWIFGIAFALTALAITYRAANTVRTDTRSKAANNTVVIRRWEFDSTNDGWISSGIQSSITDGQFMTQFPRTAAAIQLQSPDQLSAITPFNNKRVQIRVTATGDKVGILGVSDTETAAIIPNQPAWFTLLPTKLKNFLELLYLWVFVYRRPTDMAYLLEGITGGNDTECVQVVQPAINQKTGECKDFSTPCDVPEDWMKVNSCTDECLPRAACADFKPDQNNGNIPCDPPEGKVWCPETTPSVSPTPACTPRPTCLDHNPPCVITAQQNVCPPDETIKLQLKTDTHDQSEDNTFVYIPIDGVVREYSLNLPTSVNSINLEFTRNMVALFGANSDQYTNNPTTIRIDWIRIVADEVTTPTPTVTIAPSATPTPTPANAPTATPTPTQGQTQAPIISKRVLVIGFNPVENGISYADTYFRTNMNGRTAAQVEDDTFEYLRSKFSQLSNNRIRFTIAKKIQITSSVPYPDGYTFTLDSYKKCVWGSAEFDATGCESRKWQFNYSAWLSSNQICKQLQDYNADEVWMLSLPYIMAYENFMIGPTSGFFINGPGYVDTSCTKHYAVVNGTYDRSDLPFHNFGHRIESTMVYLTSKWSAADKQKYWSAFSGFDQYSSQNPTKPVCGNGHFPFNTTVGYDYGNTSVKENTCADWNNFPQLRNTTTSGNCSLWGCTDPGWQAYWFAALPHSTGDATLTSNTGNSFTFSRNWWEYILDPDAAIRKYNEIR